ncbi:GNAT family protein [Luteipulveratus sp. YIM 133132]|uniref:GNAT family N-acetyltransferase n=1 Tax=Luteipulveratus flavus TaxID=3031728 RepID=UPI0023AFAC99|nr:GNAT family protein [Luteipulveratus sp. YIM 133132]MDE9364995.1 GNAT family protein [Luteipulveratus sp. YIM 133132]
MSIEGVWPAAGLRIAAGDLELWWITDELLVRLAELAGRGVHTPETMPFTVPWTRGTPQQVARTLIAYQWGARSQFDARSMRLELAVMHRGEPVGVQAAWGDGWAVLREAETGSWLGRAHQGQGIGTRMRVLMLWLLFEGLGAAHVVSTAFADNVSSNATSRRVGYEPDGRSRVDRDGRAATRHRHRMSVERWEAVRAQNAELLGGPVVMTGVERARDQLKQARG